MGISLGTSRKLDAFCSSSMARESQSSASLLEGARRSGAPHFPTKEEQILSEPGNRERNKEYTASRSENCRFCYRFRRKKNVQWKAEASRSRSKGKKSSKGHLLRGGLLHLHESSHIRTVETTLLFFRVMSSRAFKDQKWQENQDSVLDFKTGSATFPTQAIEWDGCNYPPVILY
jgi:hypothetical protein